MVGVYKLDGIPSDLLTSAIEKQRRFKTSSRTSVEDAAINGSAVSIAAGVVISQGESIAFNLFTSANALINAINCCDLDISVFSAHCAGGIDRDGRTKSLNLNVMPLDFIDYQVTKTPLSDDNTMINSSRGSFNPTVSFDNNSKCSIKIKNNSNADYVGNIAIIFDIYKPSPSVYWLQSDTQLESNSEMSVYG